MIKKLVVSSLVIGSIFSLGGIAKASATIAEPDSINNSPLSPIETSDVLPEDLIIENADGDSFIPKMNEDGSISIYVKDDQ